MANEVFLGRDAIVKIGPAPTPTDISPNVATIAIDSATDEVVYSTLGRPKKVKLAGYNEETWTFTGPYNAESEAFWRPLTVGDAGKGLAYEVLPQGDDVGKLKWTGTLNVLSFESTGINPEEVEEYEAKAGINDKTIAPIPGP